MKKTPLIIALLLALSSPAFAQTPGTSGEKYPPPAAKGAGPAVTKEKAKIPSDSGEHNPAAPKTPATAPKEETAQYRSEMAAAKKDYKEKKAAVDADCKAQKITKADCDAKRKALKADDKAARAAIAKKYPNAAKAEHSDS